MTQWPWIRVLRHTRRINQEPAGRAQVHQTPALVHLRRAELMI